MNCKSISFEISINREKVYTFDTIPADCPVYVEREGNDYQARNR